MDDRRRGLKLIELMVIVGIIGLALGLIVPAIPSGRTSERRAHCQNNMKNVGLALVQFATVKNHLPNAGTFFDDPKVHGGDPTKSNLYRAIVNPASFRGDPGPCLYNWVTDVLAFLDQNDIGNELDRQESYLCAVPHPVPAGKDALSDTVTQTTGISNLILNSSSIQILRCPDDPSYQPGQGNLSYAVNGGFARWYPVPVGWVGGAKDGQSRNGGILHWGDDMASRLGTGQKLGVMFLGTNTGDQPWDMRATLSGIPDGASNTLLLGENTLVGYSPGTSYSGGLPTNWACPLPNFSMFLGSDDVCRSQRSETDCLAGQLSPGPQGKTGKGWAWANRVESFERMSYGTKLTVEGSFPFANSGHPGGSNFACCDGSVKFISGSIDGTVYARLITPAGETLPATIRQGPLSLVDP